MRKSRSLQQGPHRKLRQVREARGPKVQEEGNSGQYEDPVIKQRGGIDFLQMVQNQEYPGQRVNNSQVHYVPPNTFV